MDTSHAHGEVGTFCHFVHIKFVVVPNHSVNIPGPASLGSTVFIFFFWELLYFLLLRGWQVTSQDVIIDALITKLEREGALHKNRPGWVVVDQGSLLIQTLDSYSARLCGIFYACPVSGFSERAHLKRRQGREN